MPERQHWYMFVFVYSNSIKTVTKNHYSGFDDMDVTIDRIERAKQAAEIPSDAVCTGFFYCGYHTRDEMAKGYVG